MRTGRLRANRLTRLRHPERSDGADGLHLVYMPRILSLLALAALGAPPAVGQLPFESCRDRQDRLVARIEDNTMPYAGLATHQHGRPVIIWNARTNGPLSYAERMYLYLHECAHHRLGHLEHFANDARWELEADCWAIQSMMDGEIIRRRHLIQLERSRRAVRGDAIHLGGETHVRSLRQCLDVRIDEKAWAAALEAMDHASSDGFVTSRGRMVDSLHGVAVYESLVEAPGAYDCEIAGAAIRCTVFESRKPGPAIRRYEKLAGLIRRWLPEGWWATEDRRHAGGAHTFRARNGASGTLVTLAQNGPRVRFFMQREDALP